MIATKSVLFLCRLCNWRQITAIRNFSQTFSIGNRRSSPNILANRFSVGKYLSTNSEASIKDPQHESGDPEKTPFDDVNVDKSFARENWFANRYTDTSFHAVDGLDPNEWALIYRIPDEDQRTRREYLLYAFAAGAVVFGVTAMVFAFHEQRNPFTIGPGLILLGIIGATYAVRLRRNSVMRLYTSKDAQEGWEHWLMIQRSLPTKLQLIDRPPVRHYRIVWKDTMNRKHVVAYTSMEPSDIVERKREFSRSLNGNFMIKGRSWAVHKEFFEEPRDYFICRHR